MKISQAQQAVDQFHRKLQLCASDKLERSDGTGENGRLYDAYQSLQHRAKLLEEWVRYPRSLRAHLLIEELAECVEALEKGDEQQLLDGLADLLYVLLGTAAVYDLPLEAAFLEVHRSNMTKEKQPDDVSKERVRQKGPRYSPPDLARVLKEHRDTKMLHFAETQSAGDTDTTHEEDLCDE